MIPTKDLMNERNQKDDLYYDKDHNSIPQTEETEETLSFCDLPLNYNGDNWNQEQENVSTSTWKENPDHNFFEFFNDFNSEMKSAEDIIFCGKLLPYKSSPHSDFSHYQSNHLKTETGELNSKKKSLNHPHRKSISDSDLLRSQTTMKSKFLKNNSLDYRKLQSSKGNDQITGEKCPRKNVFPLRNSSQVKPKKQLCMFGVMKPPVEMELKDIRNRQNKRNPATLFPVVDGTQTASVKSNGGKSSWSLLRVLGCDGHANAVVTASLRCIPHV